MPKHSARNKAFGRVKVQHGTPREDKPKSKRGGKREGAGRPKGTGLPPTLSRRARSIRAVTDKHIRGKRLPLDVMIENMIHYQDDARSMQEDLVEAFGAGNWKMDKEEFMKTLELLSSVGDLRMKAQKCAVDAAPFIHAKLSAIAMQVEHKKAADVEDGSIERARDDFRQLRSQSYVPPVIDGEAVPVQADEAEDEEA